MVETAKSVTGLPVRNDLVATVVRAWERVGEAGAWLEASQRTAIAAETRASRRCRLCAERKEALSPFYFDGEHDSQAEALSPVMIDVVHRLTTDSSRLTSNWLRETLDDTFDDAAYVETVGVTATVAALDAFSLGLGEDPTTIPAPKRNQEPKLFRHPHATVRAEWVPTVDPPDAGGPLESYYFGRQEASPIVKALTLVPTAARQFADVARTMYLEGMHIRNWAEAPGRALDRSQIELLAARTSALKECFY